MKQQDVSALVDQFSEMKKMMTKLGVNPKSSSKRKGKKNRKRKRGGRTTAKGKGPMADPTQVLNEGLDEINDLKLPGLDFEDPRTINSE